MGIRTGLRERDLKRILARSTVAALGTLTLLIGLPGPGSGLAVVAFLFAHALYKAPLFMIAGNIDHATGTRIIDHLMGLRHSMPITAAVAVLAGLSMAGLPLSFGFVAKDIISVAKSEAELITLVSYATVFINAIAVAVAGVAAIRVFWGPSEAPRGQVHEVSWRMYLPPLAIVLLGIEFEFFPALADPLLIAAARTISPRLGEIDLDAAYDLAVLLSATGITAAIGIVFFLFWDRLHHALNQLIWFDRYGPAAFYETLLSGLAKVAAWQTQRLQHGRVSGYLRLTLAALLLMGAFGWFYTDTHLVLKWDWPEHAWAWAVACLLMIAGATAALLLRDRLVILMASGLVGYGSAVLFLFAGAPDLAFTQFAVETILVVVATSVLPHYGLTPLQREPWHWTNRLLALAAGVGTFLLLAHLQGMPVNTEMADWFGRTSLAEAYGRNVVNVIIVDFRAFDTLGEIAVVAFSLIAAMPLLAAFKKEKAS